MEKWQNLKGELYPGDEFLKQEKCCVNFKTFKDYMESKIFGDPNDKRLHLGLAPVPYVGKLKRASVFLLSLNPGLNHSDYIQDNLPQFREIYQNNLQQIGNDDFPFYYLNPLICSHPGYNYWSKKFRDIIERIKITENISWLEAQKKISKNIALLELIPYHSKKFNLDKSIINKMASVRDVKRYVKEKLIPKARNDEITLIVMRSSAIWEIQKEKNVIIYKSEAHSGTLGKNSSGFKAIMKRLNYDLY